MTRALLCMICVIAIGCATDEEGARGDRDDGLGGGAAGAGGFGNADFGNSDDFVPSAPSGALQPGGDSTCKAGHYVGQLMGVYLSPAAMGFTPSGVPVSTDPNNIDAAVINSLFPPADGVSPGFEFWLEASDDAAPCSGDEEFCFDFKVEGGKAKGVANGLFPFEMDLTGDLDCGQGRFVGIIENGWYSVAGIVYEFEGTIEGSYDESRAAFFDGVWEVHEPADPTAGGDGTWYTAWTQD